MDCHLQTKNGAEYEYCLWLPTKKRGLKPEKDLRGTFRTGSSYYRHSNCATNKRRDYYQSLKSRFWNILESSWEGIMWLYDSSKKGSSNLPIRHRPDGLLDRNARAWVTAEDYAYGMSSSYLERVT